MVSVDIKRGSDVDLQAKAAPLPQSRGTRAHSFANCVSSGESEKRLKGKHRPFETWTAAAGGDPISELDADLRDTINCHSCSCSSHFLTCCTLHDGGHELCTHASERAHTLLLRRGTCLTSTYEEVL